MVSLIGPDTAWEEYLARWAGTGGQQRQTALRVVTSASKANTGGCARWPLVTTTSQGVRATQASCPWSYFPGIIKDCGLATPAGLDLLPSQPEGNQSPALPAPLCGPAHSSHLAAHQELTRDSTGEHQGSSANWCPGQKELREGRGFDGTQKGSSFWEGRGGKNLRGMG